MKITTGCFQVSTQNVWYKNNDFIRYRFFTMTLLKSWLQIFLRSFLTLNSISPEEVFSEESDMVRGYLFGRDINYFQLRNNLLHVMKRRRCRELLSMYVRFIKVCDTPRVVCLKMYYVKKKIYIVRHFFFFFSGTKIKSQKWKNTIVHIVIKLDAGTFYYIMV